MAERSVNGELINMSPYLLTLSSFNITDGVAGQTPPQTIKANGMGQWETENGKILTGTSGNLTYTGVGPDGNFSVYCEWVNPFIGDDEFSCNTTLPGGTINYKSGDGNNASVVYTFG
jgi:hypothetical protein